MAIWQLGGMTTRLVHMVIDANDPPRLARFWAAALGWEVVAEEPDEVVVWPAGFSYPGPAALPLVFVPVPEPKAGKNRLHLDLASSSAAHQPCDRLPGSGLTLNSSRMTARRRSRTGCISTWHRIPATTSRPR